MDKKYKSLIATAAMICFTAMTSLAGQWVENGGKWFYMTDDGNFAKNTFLWLDENHDTKGELYHFDADGAMSQGTTVSMTDNSYGLNEILMINMSGTGAASDYTMISDYTGTTHATVNSKSFPMSYSINLNTDGEYVYSLDDYYDFNEIKTAYFYRNMKDDITKSDDGYTADVKLIVYTHDSESVLLNNFICNIKTTAKFAKDCKVRSLTGNKSTTISKFLKKEGYYNYLEVYSVNSDGYITDCMIEAVG